MELRGINLKKINEKSKFSINLKIINENFQCGICQGYIIDATTIIDCLHSFCKSCIVHFIKTIDHRCPTCNQNLNDLKNCIKSDSFLQRLIYRLVPNLLENELERRERFLFNDNFKSDFLLNQKSILNIQLFNIQTEKLNNKNENQTKKKINLNKTQNEKNKENQTASKYIQCIAQTPIFILTKLLRNKFNIPITYMIKLTYLDHLLDDNETLIQLFTSFIINKNQTFPIKFDLIKKTIKPSLESKNLNNVDDDLQFGIQNNKIKNNFENQKIDTDHKSNKNLSSQNDLLKNNSNRKKTKNFLKRKSTNSIIHTNKKNSMIKISIKKYPIKINLKKIK